MILESKYLSTELKEIIDSELESKLGLSLSHEMSAKITYCAFITCWILLFKKAESSFLK